MDIAAVIETTDKDIALSFLPLHHTFECTISFLYGFYSGVTIAFCDIKVKSGIILILFVFCVPVSISHS